MLRADGEESTGPRQENEEIGGCVRASRLVSWLIKRTERTITHLAVPRFTSWPTSFESQPRICSVTPNLFSLVSSRLTNAIPTSSTASCEGVSLYFVYVSVNRRNTSMIWLNERSIPHLIRPCFEGVTTVPTCMPCKRQQLLLQELNPILCLASQQHILSVLLRFGPIPENAISLPDDLITVVSVVGGCRAVEPRLDF